MNTETTHSCGSECRNRVLLAGNDGRQAASFLLYDGELSKPAGIPACQWKRSGVQIGRSSENDIALKSPVVSRKHAILVSNIGQISVIDLGSSNGTFIDGHRIEPGQPEPLLPGSEISFGHGATLTVSA